MPKSKYSLQESKRPKAIREFTDREDFIQTFDRYISNYTYNKYQILMYHGIGGIGKTTLQHELIRHLKDNIHQEVIWARIDFEEPQVRTVTQALRRLRDDLGKSPFNLQFYSFDLAFATYWKKSNPDIPLNGENFTLIEHSEILIACMDILGDFPLFGLLPKLGKAVAKGSKKFQIWWNTRGNRELQEIQEKEPYEIVRWLPALFASDITHFIQEHQKKLVVFLDTYEALWETSEERTEGRFFREDEWVRDLVNESKGVLWCISGREKLRWSEWDVEWAGLVEQHLIGDLSDEDATRFLNVAGLQDKEVIAAIVHAAKGVPFYLDLALDSWETLIEKGNEPRADIFQVDHYELFTRFMKYLDAHEQEMLKVLSIPRLFDQTLFNDLIEEFKTGYIPARFQELMRFSFVVEIETKRIYALHELMRANLQTIMSDTIKQKIHHYLFTKYDAQLHINDKELITAHHLSCLEEALFHAMGYQGSDRITDWFCTIVKPFEQSAKWELLLRLYQDLTAFLRKSAGKEHPNTVTSMNNLAVLLEKTGHYGEAEAIARSVLDINQHLWGNEHPITATSMNNLAAVLERTGRYDEAESLIRSALHIRQRIFGDEHPDTATCINNLANLFRIAGRYSEAESLFRTALDISQHILGNEHLDTATCMNNLAAVLDLVGQYDEAESLFRTALDINQRIIGNEHPETAKSMDNLANLLLHMGRYSEAESLFRMALDIRQDILGEEHPETAVSMNNLSGLLQETGHYKEAESLCRIALDIMQDNLGKEHAETVMMMDNLAVLLEKIGQYDEAESLFRTALDIKQRMLGNEHPITATSMNNLAATLERTGRYDEAESLSRTALEIHKRIWGVEHPNTIKVLYNLAVLLQTTGQYDEAESLFRNALDSSQRIWGNEHPDTATSMHNLAALLIKIGRYGDAEPLARTALDIRQRIWGNEHPDTATSMNNLAALLMKIGRYGDAEPLARTALDI
ncbi:MAG: tetratricopeptide repeat protein, partial [Candidatus Babeliaceae bacterium]|nr:tetratricopeptide repeat protein [Candidatus Babeliaceae bacterium]